MTYKDMRLTTILLFMLFSFTSAFAGDWVNFYAPTSVKSLLSEGKYLWVGGKDYLCKLNTSTGEKEYFPYKNAVVAIDRSGNKWIGTDIGRVSDDGLIQKGIGLIKYDGKTWTVFNSSNSGLPENYIKSIAVDQQENVWAGTTYNGLAKFDGNTWTVYDTSNSALPDNLVNSIAIDKHGNKWIGTYHGIAKFDGKTWTVYNKSNSGLPDNFVSIVKIDEQGQKWIGTAYGGLAKYDGQKWIVYNNSNSGLAGDFISSITIDKYGNKWIGTANGISVFREGGVIMTGMHDVTSPLIFNKTYSHSRK